MERPNNSKLWIHQKEFNAEIVISPDVLIVGVGDVVGVRCLDVFGTNGSNQGNGSNGNELYLEVTQNTIQEGLALKKKNGTVSVAKEVAETFGFQPRQEVFLRLVEPLSVSVELVELVFKEQYIGRSDMWRLNNNLINKCVYRKKHLRNSGVRATVEEIWAGGMQVMCGRIDANTKIVYRSGSSQFYILIQVSPEMFCAEEETGLLLYEKAVDGFLAELFERWRDRSCTHDVSIVLFARVYVAHKDGTNTPIPSELESAINQTEDGLQYFDCYVTTAESDGGSVISLVEIKRDILAFKELLKVPHVAAQLNNTVTRSLRNGPCSDASFATEVRLELSDADAVAAAEAKYRDFEFSIATAISGNMMAAINLSLSAFATHFIDRSFERTGQMIIVVSAGTGIFESTPTLAAFSKQRVVDNGVGVDIVCMSQPPLHLVPLLVSKESQFASNPYWLRQCFYSNTHQMDSHLKYRPARFVPRVVGARPSGDSTFISSCHLMTPRPDDEEPAQVRDYPPTHTATPTDTHTQIESSETDTHAKTHVNVDSNTNADGKIHTGGSVSGSGGRAFGGAKGSVPNKDMKARHKLHDDQVFTATKPPQSPYYSLQGGMAGSLAKLSLAPSCTSNSNTYTNGGIIYPNVLGGPESRTLGAGPSGTEAGAFGSLASNSMGVSEHQYHTNNQYISSQLSGSIRQSQPQALHSQSHTRLPTRANAPVQVQANTLYAQGEALSRGTEHQPLTAGNSEPSGMWKMDELSAMGSHSGQLNGNAQYLTSSHATYSPTSNANYHRNTPSRAHTPLSNIMTMFTQPTPSQAHNHPHSQQHSYAQVHGHTHGYTNTGTSMSMNVNMNVNGTGSGNAHGQPQTYAQMYGQHSNTTHAPSRTQPGTPQAHNAHMSTTKSLGSRDPLTGRHHSMQPMDGTPPTMPMHVYDSLDETTMQSWGHAQATPIPIIASQMESMPVINRLPTKMSHNTSLDATSTFKADRTSGAPRSFWYGSGSRHLDPYRPSTYVAFTLSYSRRRWSHLEHLTVAGRRPIQHGPNWKSLCVPACLPLTTDYYPSNEELSIQFRVKPYVVTVNDDDDESGGSDIGTNSRKVLRELVSQRLAQGFQIVQKPKSKPTGTVAGGGSLNSKQNERVEEYMLSWGHRYHVLSYDPLDNNIEIKCYTKIRERSPEGFTYHYRLWPRAHQCFQDVEIPFTVDAQNTGESNWNIMDHMILGYVEKDHMSTMRHINFWRTRFCLLPVDRGRDLNSEAEALSKEALRVSNFQRFNKLVSSMGDVDMPDIRIVPFKTTASNIVEASGRHKLAIATDMTDICTAAQTPDSGLPIGTRRIHLRVHRRCFVGNVFVDWLMKQVASVLTREDAVKLAQALMDAKLVSSTTSGQTEFRNDYSFYRFKDSSPKDNVKSSEPMTDLWMSECVVYDRTKDIQRLMAQTSDPDYRNMRKKLATPNSTTFNNSTGAASNPKNSSMHSNSPSQPDRSQTGWVVIHFDKTYNPLRPYHVEFHWMVSSAVMMDELMQLLHRKARGCKFRFVPVPTAPLLYRYANASPFRAPIFIPLAVPASLLTRAEPDTDTFDSSDTVDAGTSVGTESTEERATHLDMKKGTANVQTHNSTDQDRDAEQLDEVGQTSNLYDFMAIILTKFSFVVDVEADSRNKTALLGVNPKRTYLPPEYTCSQWVHSTGISLVQVVDEGQPPGFLWMRNHLLTAKWRRAGAIGGEQLSEDDLLCDFEAFCRSQERVQQLLTEVNDTRTDTTDDPRTDAKSQDSHLDSTKNTHTDARADPKKHESLIDNTRSTHTVHTDSLKEKEARAEAVESAVSALENATQPHTSQEVSTKTYADKRIGATAADHTGGDGD